MDIVIYKDCNENSEKYAIELKYPTNGEAYNYLKFPKIQTLSGKLSWSHYTEIIKANSDLEIGFYTKQCENENWSLGLLNFLLLVRECLDAAFHEGRSEVNHLLERDFAAVLHPLAV